MSSSFGEQREAVLVEPRFICDEPTRERFEAFGEQRTRLVRTHLNIVELVAGRHLSLATSRAERPEEGLRAGLAVEVAPNGVAQGPV